MPAHTITEIQSLGVRVPADTPNRKGGAGPAEGGVIILDGIPAHAPLSGAFVSKSPYALLEVDGETRLTKDGECVLPATVVPRPKFYDYVTKDQTPYSSIAQLHGKDCVASTVLQTCVYWHSEKRCQFCGIELSLSGGRTTRLKTPAQLAEVVLKAMELDSAAHVVLTTGAALPSGNEIDYLGRCAGAIKQVCDLPIHVQFLPPDNAEKLCELKESGVDTVGIHIESFDKEVLARLAPVKAAIGLERYEEAWNRAVDVFGFNQVSSFVLVGLGEEEDSVIRGSEFLADRGVYPFVVPFRPIPGSLMEDCGTPDHETMKRLYGEITGILIKRGLSAASSLAGCVRCGACSALGAYEREAGKDFICRPTVTDDEVAVALQIRNDVFVREQGLFEITDIDENDSCSAHIIVEHDGRIVGTVRVFPETDRPNHWVGGRLAVRKKHRNNHVGALLVREAMRYVKDRGCARFTAHIQEQNVRFFVLLGWKIVGPVEIYHGKAHRVMEADLNRV